MFTDESNLRWYYQQLRYPEMSALQYSIEKYQKTYSYPFKPSKERYYNKNEIILLINDRMHIVNTKYDIFTRF